MKISREYPGNLTSDKKPYGNMSKCNHLWQINKEIKKTL